LTSFSVVDGLMPSLTAFAFSVNFLIWPLLSILILRLANIRLLSLTIPAVFFFYYLLLAYVGHWPLFWGSYEYQLTEGLLSTTRIVQLMNYSGSCITLVCLGMAAVPTIIDAPKRKLLLARASEPMRPLRLTLAQRRWLTIVTALALLVTVEYFSHIQDIALVALIRGTGDVKLLRSQMTNGFSGPLPYHYYQLAFGVILPFCCYAWLTHALANKRITSWVIFFSILILTCLISIADLQKAQIVWFLLGLGFTGLLASPSKLRLKMIMFGIPIILGITFFVFKVFMEIGDRSIGEITSSTTERVIVGALSPTYFYKELFPQAMDFLGGVTFPNPRHIFPWDPFPYTRYIYDYTQPKIAALGLHGSTPAPFWGQLYIDFGNIGILLISPLVGCVLMGYQLFLYMMKESDWKPALTSWLVLHLVKLAEIGIGSFLIDTDVAAILGITLVGIVLGSSPGADHGVREPAKN